MGAALPAMCALSYNTEPYTLGVAARKLWLLAIGNANINSKLKAARRYAVF